MQKGSEKWMKDILKKGHTLLLSVFLCFSLGVSGVKKVNAGSSSVTETGRGAEVTSVASKNRMNLLDARKITGKREKKTIQADFIISKKSSKNAKNSLIQSSSAVFTGKNVPSSKDVAITASIYHTEDGIIGTEENEGKVVRAPKRKGISYSFGAVELKEAEKEVTQTLDGLAHFMKGDCLLSVVRVFACVSVQHISAFIVLYPCWSTSMVSSPL